MKRSLHIGLNMVDPAAYNGWPGYLQACDNDAANLGALAAQNGFEATGLIDANATLENVRSVILGAAEQCVADDLFVLTDSSHGGRNGAWNLSGYSETLCFYDGQMADTELHELLAKFRPGVRIIVILDSCHSGGMDRDLKRNRFMPAHVGEALSVPSTPLARSTISASILLFAACRAEETAEDGSANGAFTGSLLATWDQLLKTGRPSWLQWFKATSSYMARNFPAQHPVERVLGLGTDQLQTQPAFA